MKAPTDTPHDPTQAPRELGDLITDPPVRKEMESVTEVNGTVARFEMAYSPVTGARRAVSFGPPLRQRVPSLVFFAFGLTLVTLVVVAYYAASSNSSLYRWIVEGDRARPLPAAALAFVVFISGLGTVVRAQMRGVLVHPDGVEGRYLLPMGVPRVKRWAWAQVERIVIDDEGAMLELWDGRYERLPDVARPVDLGAMLEHIATQRRIVVTRLEPVGGKRRRG